MLDIGRRKFITLLGGAAATWSIAARAQQSSMPVIGFLASASEHGSSGFLAAFRNGLAESGYAEGRNVEIEYRWADNQYNRLSALAAELVRRPVLVIVASGGPAAPIAAKAATSTIPIIFTATSDPVRLGLVASLHRPGSNVTGTGAFTAELDAKRLEVLLELVLRPGQIGALINPNRPDADAQSQDVQRAAHALGQQVSILTAGSEREIDAALRIWSSSGSGRCWLARTRFFKPASTSRGTRRAPRGARRVHESRLHSGRRLGKLWHKHRRWVSSSRNLCRPNSQRRQAS